jgi:hypothetical protein
MSLNDTLQQIEVEIGCRPKFWMRPALFVLILFQIEPPNWLIANGFEIKIEAK